MNTDSSRESKLATFGFKYTYLCMMCKSNHVCVRLSSVPPTWHWHTEAVGEFFFLFFLALIDVVGMQNYIYVVFHNELWRLNLLLK